MIGPDSYYTPIPIAEKLVSYITENNINNVIDFCVGDGVLLKTVKKKFYDVNLYGTDISSDAITLIKKEYPNWSLGVCDFRDDKSIAKIHFLRKTKFDIIMFNPPFTCKGSVIERINIEKKEFKVSTAMMFILKSIKYLSPRGGIYAILPISCIYSQKDRDAWNFLKSNYNACVLEESIRVCFEKKCSPNIVLVYIGKNKRSSYIKNQTADFTKLSVENVSRGHIRMQNLTYSTSIKALPLIHTTNIQKGQLVNLKHIIPRTQQCVGGFGVVIPRVCNPNHNKVALLDGHQNYLLSDCVIVLKTSTMESAAKIKEYIINNWSSFKSIYKGTGAQYTTLERVKALFGLKP